MVDLERAGRSISSRRWGKVFSSLMILLVLVLLVWQVSPLVNKVDFDQSNLIYDAHRLAQGQVPYRDFFSFLPPGSLYLMSGGPWAWWGRPETGVRYLCICFVLLSWVVVSFALKRAAVRDDFPSGWIGAIIPVCLFPFAAFATHHWIADALYICAIAIASKLWRKREWTMGWTYLGLMTGTVLCFLQTAGALALILLLFTLLTTSSSLKDLFLKGLRALAGVAAAFLVFVGPLLALGAGKAYLYYVYEWTFLNYRRPGNINAEAFLADFPLRLEALWRSVVTGFSLDRLTQAFSGTLVYFFLCGLGAAVVVGSLYVLSRIFLKRRLPSPERVSAAVITLATLGVYCFTRSDWSHLAMILPPVLLLWGLVLASSIRSAVLVRTVRIVVVALLLCGTVFEGTILVRHIPRLWELNDVDRVDRDSPLNKSLRMSPLLKAGDTIVALPSGGNIYLYTYPAAIGYTYLFPLDDGYNSMRDHRIAAREIREKRPEMILIHRIRERDYMDSLSPIAEIIRRDYFLYGKTPAVDVFLLKHHEDKEDR